LRGKARGCYPRRGGWSSAVVVTSDRKISLRQ
jgi:hypothetical protein